jgi:hypothetical protein
MYPWSISSLVTAYLISSLLSQHLLEDDIAGGSDNIKRALVELFYELHKQQEKLGGSLFKVIKSSISTMVREPAQSFSVIAPTVDADADNLL